MLVVFGEQREIGRTKAGMKCGSYGKPRGQTGVRLGRSYVSIQEFIPKALKRHTKFFRGE